jgi:hypothetical protein
MTTLVGALLLEHSLVLFSQLLVDLGSLGGLVAVCACGKRGILLALTVLERLLLALLLTLLLALELVGNGSLVLCRCLLVERLAKRWLITWDIGQLPWMQGWEKHT